MDLDVMLDRLAWDALLLVTLCAGWALAWYVESYWRAGSKVDEALPDARPMSLDHLRPLNWVPPMRVIPERGTHATSVKAARLHPAGHAPGS